MSTPHSAPHYAQPLLHTSVSPWPGRSPELVQLQGYIPYYSLSELRADPLLDRAPARLELLPGCFQSVLHLQPPVIVNHVSRPICQARLQDSAAGLLVLFELDAAKPVDQFILADLQHGRVTGLSFGFVSAAWQVDRLSNGEQVRAVIEISSLLEITLCRAPERPLFPSAYVERID